MKIFRLDSLGDIEPLGMDERLAADGADNIRPFLPERPAILMITGILANDVFIFEVRGC